MNTIPNSLSAMKITALCSNLQSQTQPNRINMNTLHPHAARLRAAATSILLALAVVLGIPRATATDANPPNRMTYQGFLVDANGDALGKTNSRNYDVIFRIYDFQEGGRVLWGEQQTVTVDKGYFSVLLGEGATTDDSDPRPDLATLFAAEDASDRFVGIFV